MSISSVSPISYDELSSQSQSTSNQNLEAAAATGLDKPASEMTQQEITEIALDLFAGPDAETVLEDD